MCKASVVEILPHEPLSLPWVSYNWHNHNLKHPLAELQVSHVVVCVCRGILEAQQTYVRKPDPAVVSSYQTGRSSNWKKIRLKAC